MAEAGGFLSADQQAAADEIVRPIRARLEVWQSAVRRYDPARD